MSLHWIFIHLLAYEYKTMFKGNYTYLIKTLIKFLIESKKLSGLADELTMTQICFLKISNRIRFNWNSRLEHNFEIWWFERNQGPNFLTFKVSHVGDLLITVTYASAMNMLHA